MLEKKRFNQFITESREDPDGNTLDDLYQMGSEEISRAASFIVYGNDWDNKDPEKDRRWDNLNSMDPSEIIPELRKAIEIETDPRVKRNWNQLLLQLKISIMKYLILTQGMMEMTMSGMKMMNIIRRILTMMKMRIGNLKKYIIT